MNILAAIKTSGLILLLTTQLPGYANADTLNGRLFTTPAERQSLDVLRAEAKTTVLQEAIEGEEVMAPPPLPSSVAVQGYVQRGDGKKGTVWVNNSPVQENSETAEVKVGKLPRSGGQVQISIPASGRNVNLKAGQVYVPETDSISEYKARVSEPAVPNGSEAGTIGAYPGEGQ